NWKSLLQAALIPAATMAVLVPWTIRNYIVFEHFIPLSTMAGSGLLQGNNDVVVTDPQFFGYCVCDTSIPGYKEILGSAGTELARDVRAKTLAIQSLKSHPGQWWFLIRHKFWRSLPPFLASTSSRFSRLGILVTWGPVLALFGIASFPTMFAFLRERSPNWLI